MLNAATEEASAGVTAAKEAVAKKATPEKATPEEAARTGGRPSICLARQNLVVIVRNNNYRVQYA